MYWYNRNWDEYICPYREVSFIWRLKCTGIIGIGMSRFVLYKEVFFIRRFHCLFWHFYRRQVQESVQKIAPSLGFAGNLSFVPVTFSKGSFGLHWTV